MFRKVTTIYFINMFMKLYIDKIHAEDNVDFIQLCEISR